MGFLNTEGDNCMQKAEWTCSWEMGGKSGQREKLVHSTFPNEALADPYREFWSSGWPFRVEAN